MAAERGGASGDLAIIDQLLELEQLGAQVEVVSAECADRAQMKKVLDWVDKRFGPVDGVIHAAGVVQAGLIQAKTRDTANSVLALIRLPAPYGAPGAREVVRQVERKLGSDRAVVRVLDASTAQNPAMVARDRRSTYVLAALRPLSAAEQEATGKRLVAAFAGDDRVTLGGGSPRSCSA